VNHDFYHVLVSDDEEATKGGVQPGEGRFCANNRLMSTFDGFGIEL
jgi:hypothetical protein